MAREERSIYRFKQLLRPLLPLMERHHQTAFQQYRASTISRHRFFNVELRYQIAKTLVSDIPPISHLPTAMHAASPIFLDIQAGLQLYSDYDFVEFRAAACALLAFYRQEGFTQKHPRYHTPLPAPTMSLDQHIFRDPHEELSASLQHYPTYAEFTLVMPKKEDQEFVLVDNKTSDFNPMVLRKAVELGLLTPRHRSRNNPQLNAVYSTFVFSDSLHQSA